MANITITTGSVSAVAGMGLEIKGLAGASLGAGNACYIGASGEILQSSSAKYIGDFTGTAGRTNFDGIAVRDVVSGDAVTLFGRGSVIGGFASGMTPGAALWISGTGGILSDAKIATQDAPVAKAISATDILIIR